MNLKKGVTFSVILVAIVIMLIVISSASIIGSRSINTAKYEEFKSEIQRLSDNINEYYVTTKKLPIIGSIVDTNSLDENLQTVISNNGESSSAFYVIDMDKVRDTSIKSGTGDLSSKDVYILCEQTQRIYYVKGYKYNGITYYTK